MIDPLTGTPLMVPQSNGHTRPVHPVAPITGESAFAD